MLEGLSAKGWLFRNVEGKTIQAGQYLSLNETIDRPLLLQWDRFAGLDLRGSSLNASGSEEI